MKEEFRKKLYESLDGSISRPDRMALKSAMNGDHGPLHIEQEQAIRLRETLGQTAAGGFGPFFVHKVMAAIEELPGNVRSVSQFFENVKRWHRMTLVVGTAMIVAMIFLNLIAAESPSVGAAFGFEQASPDSIWTTPLEQVMGAD